MVTAVSNEKYIVFKMYFKPGQNRKRRLAFQISYGIKFAFQFFQTLELINVMSLFICFAIFRVLMQ